MPFSEGLQGNKKAAESFKQLGLSAQELSGLKTDEAMRRVAVALSEVENANVRAQIGTDILGKGFKENAGFFADAANQIDGVNAALAAAGATLDDVDVAKIGVMNDELALQGTIVQNLGTKFLANLSPAVGVATDSFAALMTNMGGATEAGKAFGVIMTAAVKMVEAAVYGLAAVFESLRWAVARVLEFITGYSLIDGVGVRRSGNAFSYTAWVLMIGGSVFSLMMTVFDRKRMLEYVLQRWRKGVFGGGCTLASYSLALWAMTKAPIGPVAALRETSIVFSALLAVVILKENISPLRWISIIVVTAGAIAIKGL